MQIVKCKRFKRAEMEAMPGFVYCGRAAWGFAASPLANPFKPGEHGTLEEVIEKYRLHLLQRIEAGDRKILDALYALTKDSVLGCWCKPRGCHCDVIVEVWERAGRFVYNDARAIICPASARGRHGEEGTAVILTRPPDPSLAWSEHAR